MSTLTSKLQAICVIENNIHIFFLISSSLTSINSRVLQDSIVGLILFISYRSDITRCSNAVSFLLYVYATNIFIQGANIAELETKSNVESAHVANM